MSPFQLDDLDLTVSPNSAYFGETVTVKCNSGIQGSQITIWLQEITHDLMPDVDSVLLASLEVTNKTFSYNFKLRPEMGPTQAGEMFSILPNKRLFIKRI